MTDQEYPDLEIAVIMSVHYARTLLGILREYASDQDIFIQRGADPALADRLTQRARTAERFADNLERLLNHIPATEGKGDR